MSILRQLSLYLLQTSVVIRVLSCVPASLVTKRFSFVPAKLIWAGFGVGNVVEIFNFPDLGEVLESSRISE